ncbi:RIP metalloprotease RseP [Chitinophaga sp. GCM10012297]|uniref:Zinc metalloprotease n=1 Tax=Chitinophaga chungangae TaxID=2821488 RepID=A0ABS3YM80_9BACT|nr:RIP metalloprotease RseP [Chitinophaga chungangae]MBO9155184.1 RIP metalloprotease RseP [Chitinophaga chungangae]
METSEILIKAGQLILSLSILVVLHEMGHFIPAKLFKTKVEKFYLFFDPWFSLFKFKKGDTEYGVGWLPLGGYVKISGMIDESMDKEQLNKPPQPWEFRSKPAWQRLIIMIGGVTVNLILGFFIYSMILWQWGDDYLPIRNAKYGIYADSLAQSIGLRDGDHIIAVDSVKKEKFEEITGDVILNQAKTIQIERDGREMSITIPQGFVNKTINKKAPIALPRMLSILDTVFPKGNAYKSGIRNGDRVLSVNDTAVTYFMDMAKMIKRQAGKPVKLTILRGADTLTFNPLVSPKDNLMLGYSINKQLDVVHVSYTFGEAIPAGFKKAISTLVKYVQQLRLIFVSPEVKASESLGGFMSIGSLFPSVWDWQSFWELTALLSIILAFMNILPIPALDGGHVLFLIYEMITGRKPGEKFMEYAQIVGMVILFGLLLYANGLDVWRWITSKF